MNKAGGGGRPIQPVIEQQQTTNPGIVLAFSKFAGDKRIPAFIGPARSTRVHAVAPDIQRIGKPVMIGGTIRSLPTWAIHGYSDFAQTTSIRPGDGGLRRENPRQEEVGIVRSTDAFGTNGMKNLVAVLNGMGVEPAWSRATLVIPRISRRSRLPLNSRAPMSWAPYGFPDGCRYLR